MLPPTHLQPGFQVQHLGHPRQREPRVGPGPARQPLLPLGPAFNPALAAALHGLGRPCCGPAADVTTIVNAVAVAAVLAAPVAAAAVFPVAAAAAAAACHKAQQGRDGPGAE